MALDLKTELCDYGSIRVVMVPIDDMSSGTWTKYSTLLRRFAEIELRQLTQTSRAATDLIPKRPRQDALIRYSFVDYDRHHPSPWTELQLHRRVLGVIGVFHCQSGDPNLSVAARKFSEVLNKFPSALASICFAFDPLENQPDLDKAGGNVIMIPNTSEAEHLSFYLTTLVQDFTARILKQLEQDVVAQQTVAYISTPLDNTKTSEEISKLKKKKAGRHAKRKGDAALLLGSPEDAIRWYASSIDQCRSNNDQVWLAASHEGMAVANVTLQTNWLTKPFNDASIQTIEDKCRDAIALYHKRKEAILELELILRTARALISFKQCHGFVSELLNSAQSISSGGGVSARNRALVAISLTQLHEKLGRKRHSAMHGRAAANASVSSNRPHIALSLLHNAAKAMQADVARSPDELAAQVAHKPILQNKDIAEIQVANRWKPQNDRRLTSNPKFGWFSLQKMLLLELANAARQCNDVNAGAQYNAALLTRVAPYADEKTQQDLLDSLLVLVESLHKPVTAQKLRVLSPLSMPINDVDLCGVPTLERLEVLPLPSHLVAVTTKATASNSDDIFIFSPYAQERSSKTKVRPTAVVDSPIEVRVYLTNPLSIELDISNIELSTCGVPFEPIPDIVELPANAKSFPVLLRGYVRAPPHNTSDDNETDAAAAVAAADDGDNAGSVGALYIRGCHVRVCSVSCEHVVSPFGNGVPPEVFARIDPNVYETAPEAIETRIPVFPCLPLLEASIETSSGQIPPLTLMEGEQTTAWLVISNNGTKAIANLKLSLQSFDCPEPIADSPIERDPRLEANDEFALGSSSGIVWNEQTLSQLLPIDCGETKRVPLQLMGAPLIRGAKVLLEYKSSNTEAFCRHAMVPLPLRIVPSVALTRFNVLPCASNPHEEAFLQCEIANLTTKNVLLSVHLKKLWPTEERSKECMLEGRSSRRMMLRVRRLSLNAEQLPQLKEFDPNSKTFDRSLLTLTNRQTLMLRRREWYAAHLKSNLTISWKLMDASSSCGIVGLSQLFLSGLDLRNFAAPQALISMKLEEKEIIVGKFFTISVCVRNCGAEALPNLTLSLKPFQDAENGARVYRLEHRLLVSGVSLVDVPALQPGAAFQHQIQLCAAIAAPFKCEATLKGVSYEANKYPTDGSNSEHVTWQTQTLTFVAIKGLPPQ